ncbi:MAG: ABC transporter permease subunit [Acidimicrobiales bacterium]
MTTVTTATATAATLAPPRRVSLPAARVLAPAAGAVCTLVLWQIGGRAGWADGMIVTPAQALEPITGDTAELYRRATFATLGAATRGLVVGSLIAFSAALLAAGVPVLRRAISRLAAVANAAPWVAVAPCLLVVLGRDRGPAAVAALAVFFYVFVATSNGLGAAPLASHDVLTALGTSRHRRLVMLQIPGCWPSVVDGLKLAAPAAVAGAIFGEWYGAPRGLGVLLISAMQSGRAERLWAASLLSAAAGLVAYALLATLRAVMVRRYGASITQTAERSTATRPAARTLLVELVTSLAIGAGLVLIWFTWIEWADISPLVVPRPSAVWDDLVATPGDYVSAAFATLVTALVALAIGATVALVAAIAASRSRFLSGLVVPIIVVVAATPLVALLPLLARVFGYEPGTVRILSATMVFFPVFVAARSGLAAAPGAAGDAIHALGAGAGRRFRLLELPAAVPHLASGLRLAAGTAVIAAVVGESLIGRDGLGVEFTLAYRQLDLPRAFGVAIVIVVVSVTVFALAGIAERAAHRRWV